MRERYDEDGLRQRRHDTALIAERVALAVGGGRPGPGPRLGRDDGRRLPAQAGADGRPHRAVQRASARPLPGVLAPAEMPAADAALDAAIEVYRWHRRLAGDARKKNALLQLLYKGG